VEIRVEDKIERNTIIERKREEKKGPERERKDYKVRKRMKS
jgi:hypothetical protein